jgi:hypothetical protein
MFPFGARVLTRNGMPGKIVRQLTNHPPYQYLVATLAGKPRILFHTDLRLVAGVERWLITHEPWKDFERRKGERRRRERRRGEQNRADKSRSDRRVFDRRQAERRWIVAK